uniref:39S ribosomal protein L46, mitochondrial-like n=1 Tax=Styela clava TaxID=7725 RepID=UPI00193AB7E0|nr:39S ribosomal protein L46, mitochondrial-like [Styela clava]
MAALRSFQRVIFSAVRNRQNLLSSDNASYFQRFKQTTPLKKVATLENKNLLKWELTSAVCLTRLPLVSPYLSQLEQNYMKLLENQEFEKSVYCDWEVEKLRQNEIIRAVESGDAENDAVDFQVTHVDMEDEYEAKFKEFLKNEPMPDIDDDDRTNPNRKIRDSITYVVKKKLGNHGLWVLPSAPVDDKETMRQCAERSLSLHSLGHYKGTILSNAPSGYFKYKFPKEVRLKNCGIGAKVFIYSALLKDTNIFNSKQLEHVMAGSQEEDCEILDYAWVTKEELSKLMKPKYFEAVSKLLS